MADSTGRVLSKLLRSRSVAGLLFLTAAVILFSFLFTDRHFFVFFDGQEMIVFETNTRDVQKALEESGIVIGQYDHVVIQSGDRGGNSTQEVVIERAGLITVQADGQTRTAVSSGETVGAVLERLSIPVGLLDEVTPGLGAVAKAGAYITVTRVNNEIIQESVSLPYETIRTPNSGLAQGKEVIVQEGREGEKVTFYEVSYEEGRELNRRFLKEVVTVDPQDELVEYGTGGTVTTFGGETYLYSRKLECLATAYSSEGLSNKLTALGTIARVGAVAVDPRVIPLRSRVYVVGTNGRWEYPVSRCEDTGGLIKGNRIDLYFDTQAECYRFGVRRCYVYVLK